VERPAENFSTLPLDETLAIFFDVHDLAASSCPPANPHHPFLSPPQVSDCTSMRASTARPCSWRGSADC
jgi:hypothetical protein